MLRASRRWTLITNQRVITCLLAESGTLLVMKAVRAAGPCAPASEAADRQNVLPLPAPHPNRKALVLVSDWSPASRLTITRGRRRRRRTLRTLRRTVLAHCGPHAGRGPWRAYRTVDVPRGKSSDAFEGCTPHLLGRRQEGGDSSEQTYRNNNSVCTTPDNRRL